MYRNRHRIASSASAKCATISLTTFQVRTPDQLLGRDIAQTPIELRWGGLLYTEGS